jgi:hypothetical protein
MLLYLLLKVCLLAVLMAFITPVRYSVKKSALIIVSIHGVSWIANYLFYVYLGNDFLSNFYVLTAGIPGFICFNIIAKYRGLKVLFSLLTVTIFALLASFVGYLADIYSGNALLQLGVKVISFVLIILFMVKVFRKPYLKILQTLDAGWGLLCLVPGLLINVVGLMQFTTTADKPQNMPAVFFVFALTFVLYAILYYNFENISQFFQLRRDREVLAVQTELYKKEYISMVDHIDANKIYHHDMKHHLNAIHTFLSGNNIDEALRYISRLDDKLSQSVIQKYCENYVVNVILSSYIGKAKKERIKVIHELYVPENIAVDDIELGLIFANALENAINACTKIENPDDRTIIITGKFQHEQLYIRISNPFVGEVPFDGEFPVSNAEGHGMGSRSIAAIAQKYGGMFSFVAQGGVFKTTVSLKC